jgi:RNA polymerase sigma-70 factor (ECF subfamily)
MTDEQIADWLWRERGKCFRIAISYVKNEHDAMDVVSESFLKALKNFKTVKHLEFSSTWLIKIVINTAIDQIRKNNKISAGTIVEESINNSSAEDDVFDLNQALDMLPIEIKTVIILRFFEDLKLSEIGEILDLSLSTIKHRLYFGLEKLNISLSPSKVEGR